MTFKMITATEARDQLNTVPNGYVLKALDESIRDAVKQGHDYVEVTMMYDTLPMYVNYLKDLGFNVMLDEAHAKTIVKVMIKW